MDENPLSDKKIDFTQYMYGVFLVKFTKLSISLVFHTVRVENFYSDISHRMVVDFYFPLDGYIYLYDSFDKEKFSTNLFHSYITGYYQL